MRLKLGRNVRVILNDGTTITGVVRFSWRFRVVKLEGAVVQSRQGDMKADGHLLIPARSILFVQVGNQ